MQPNLAMVISKRLVRTNYLLKISIHQFINYVYIIEGLLLGRPYYILDGNDLWKMIENSRILSKRREMGNNFKRCTRTQSDQNPSLEKLMKPLTLSCSGLRKSKIIHQIIQILKLHEEIVVPTLQSQFSRSFQ